MLENIIGAFVGAVYGAFCYALAKVKSGEKFTPEKFGKTVVIGFIFGGLSRMLGVDIETLEGMSTVGFFTIVIDKLVGLLQRPQE